MTAPAAGPSATGSIEVAASADAAYALVTDLGAMAALASETERMEWVSGSGAAPGAVFRGHNRNGARRWSTTCTVTDAEAGRRFAFEVRSGPLRIARWQYDVEPLGPERCRVTESTWDQRPGWFRRPGGWLTGVADRTAASREHITATLVEVKGSLES